MKTFYTERDIENMHAAGVVEIEIDDDVVLTDLARERAIVLGIHMARVDKRSGRPETPGMPRLAVAPQMQLPPAVIGPPSTTPTPPPPAPAVDSAAAPPVAGEDLTDSHTPSPSVDSTAAPPVAGEDITDSPAPAPAVDSAAASPVAGEDLTDSPAPSPAPAVDSPALNPELISRIKAAVIAKIDTTEYNDLLDQVIPLVLARLEAQ